MRVIIIPDEGEWVAVPKVATREMLEACVRCFNAKDLYAAMIAAAPPCKVVELPERQSDETAYVAEKYVHRREGWNDYRTEIERRAKG